LEPSNLIAAILGPTLFVVATSEALNFRIWKDVPPTVVTLNGLVLFVAGLVIVALHNLWVADWRVLITLSGWLLVAVGAWRQYLPTATQAKPGPVANAGLGALTLLGAVLAWFGWSAL